MYLYKRNLRNWRRSQWSSWVHYLHHVPASVWSACKPHWGTSGVSAVEPLREGLIGVGVCWCMLLLLRVSIIHIVSWRASAERQPGAVSHHHTQSRACQNRWSHRLSTVEEHWAVIHILLPRQASLNPGPAMKSWRLIKDALCQNHRRATMLWTRLVMIDWPCLPIRWYWHQ